MNETCLNRTLNKMKPCIKYTFNKVQMYKIFINLTCINRTQKAVFVLTHLPVAWDK